MKLMYSYSYGTEDGNYEIEVFQLENELYQVIFDQTVVGKFIDISSAHKIIDKKDVELYDNDSHMYNKKTKLIIKAVCNPPPEKIFMFI